MDKRLQNMTELGSSIYNRTFTNEQEKNDNYVPTHTTFLSFLATQQCWGFDMPHPQGSQVMKTSALPTSQSG